jgi:hypothetical protein
MHCTTPIEAKISHYVPYSTYFNCSQISIRIFHPLPLAAASLLIGAEFTGNPRAFRVARTV